MRESLACSLNRLRHDERGVTLVEYGIALILAIGVGVVLLTQLATSINGQLTEASACISANSC